MKVSTKGRYAVRMMLDLAEHSGVGYVPLRDISKRQGISAKYLEQIIPPLNKAGFLRSSRGNGGGYQLTRDPSEYTIGSILRIMEGSLAPVVCLYDESYECERTESCETLDFWKGLSDVINDYVDGFTLQDIMDRSPSYSGDDYSI